MGKDSRQKRQDNTVYVPALNPSLHHPLSPKEDIISHTRFDQAEFSLDPSAWDVKKRKIVFSNIIKCIKFQSLEPGFNSELHLSINQVLLKISDYYRPEARPESNPGNNPGRRSRVEFITKEKEHQAIMCLERS